MKAPATVVIVTHNSADYIDTLLSTLQADPEGPAEIIVVDSASSDGTADLARQHGVHTIEHPENIGFAGGCNEGARSAQQETLVFVNSDTEPVDGWLPPLVDAAGQPGVGAAMATIELTANPGHFNTSGGNITFAGVAWATDVDAPVPDDDPPTTVVPFPSGAAMAITRTVWQRVGGMRSEFFLYHEDTDLGWRLRLLDLRTVRVSASRVRHDYEFARNPNKLALLERNRRLMLLANYRTGTRLLLGPALFLVNLGVLIVAIRDGWWRDKLVAGRRARAHRSATRSWRARIDASRTVGDAAIITERPVGLSGMSQISVPRGGRLAEAIIGGWLELVEPLIRFFDRRRGLD